MIRKKTKQISVGKVLVGGDSPITVQSMTNTKTKNIEATVSQIKELEEAKCDIVRLAITDEEDARAIEEIKKYSQVPLVADIQFDYKLALLSVEKGIDCLRINPGNIGSREKVKKLVHACREKNIPIRIGVNAGSLSKTMLDEYGGVNENSMVYSAMEHVRILEDLDFTNIKISLKASNVSLSIKAYEKMSELVDYPLHLGITESGPSGSGTIKSAVGIGSLLSRGIGDTIRVSLTGNPVEEVYVGREILKSLDLLKSGINIVSCPTCGRTEIDLIALVKKAEKELEKIDKNITVAIMGCPVNGPGEAREADIGIAGGIGEGILFKKGKVIDRVPEEQLLDRLIKEIKDM